MPRRDDGSKQLKGGDDRLQENGGGPGGGPGGSDCDEQHD